MSIVSYNTCCCDCAKINGAKGIIVVNGSVDKYLKMTEYEFQSTLDNWMEEVDSHCHFCGSKNVYGENIEIDNIALYNFESIVEDLKKSNRAQNFLIFNLLKSNGKITREIGGKGRNEDEFILECWPQIVGAINEIPSKRFVNNNNDGQFFISVTGDIQDIKIHRLKLNGFEKSEIIGAVNEYFMRYNFF